MTIYFMRFFIADLVMHFVRWSAARSRSASSTRRPDAWITGCAVAQHCYNGDVSFLWENGNFDPCKIETLEHIDTQFVRIDFVHERNVCSKFGKNRFTGDFWAKG